MAKNVGAGLRALPKGYRKPSEDYINPSYFNQQIISRMFELRLQSPVLDIPKQRRVPYKMRKKEKLRN